MTRLPKGKITQNNKQSRKQQKRYMALSVIWARPTTIYKRSTHLFPYESYQKKKISIILKFLKVLNDTKPEEKYFVT